jgi:hypothetical protein
MLNVLMLSLVMQNVIMLNVFMLSVVMLGVVVPNTDLSQTRPHAKLAGGKLHGAVDIRQHLQPSFIVLAGNTKGGSITVLLTSCLTGLESAV